MRKITSGIDQDEIVRQPTFPIFFLPCGSFPHAYGAIDGQSLTHSSFKILFAIAKERRGEMSEYDERNNCLSNMYLPSCTYYVSAPDFSSISSFLPKTTSCQNNCPYSSNIAQVRPVRGVAFRDYGLDHPSKWHYRGNYASYYSTEEIMHRDLIQSSNMAEIILKNDSLYGHHGGMNSPCNLFTNVGRNGVLPQGFDQFFQTVNSEKPNSGPEHSNQKADSSLPGDAACNKQTSDSTEDIDEHDSSISNCPGDKNNSPSRYTH